MIFLSTYYCNCNAVSNVDNVMLIKSPSNAAVWENWDEILDRIWWRRKTSLKLAVWENSESAAAVLAIPILYCVSLLCVTLCCVSDSHPLLLFFTLRYTLRFPSFIRLYNLATCVMSRTEQVTKESDCERIQGQTTKQNHWTNKTKVFFWQTFC